MSCTSRNGEKEQVEKIKLNETFSGEVTFTGQDVLCESGDFSSEIDGTNIIGMVEGQFFQPDGMSRNKRWYSRKLWENVLACADVRNRLMSRTMYGEIGHSDGPVTDMTLREGNVSHIIADLWIDEKGRGMGRAYILDTPKGRLLKTYLGAKSKLKVSTRGEGVYLDGQYHDGCPIIDPDTYELQTVDFVLNPGFMETSAKLTTKQENYTPETKQVNEAKKEGVKRMDLNLENYVAELKEELKAAKADVKTLTEQLQTKDKELLKYQYEESAEVKKITEEFAPYKKMGVSAKTLTETFKKVQNSLKKTQEEKAKLTEELQAYKDRCGESIPELDEALEMSKKAMETVAEYQKIGTVEQLKALMEKSESLVPKLKQLAVLTEYKKLGSVKDLKSLMERCDEALPKLEQLSILEEYKSLGSIEDIKKLSEKCSAMLPKLEQLSSLKEYRKIGTVDEVKSLVEKCEKSLPKLKELKVLEAYKEIGSIEDIKKLSENCTAMLPKIKQLKEAEKLAENVKKIMPRLKAMKNLEESAEQAGKIIEQYLETVGTIKKAKELVESRKETIKTANIKEAMEVSKKFGCNIESAAKLLKKFGKEKATKLLEAEIAKQKPVETKKLAESAELVEEVKEIKEETEVKVNAKPETKDAKDFLKSGMIMNDANLEAWGKKLIHIENLDKLDGNKVAGEDQAKALLNKFKDNVEVEKAPKVEPEKDPAKAEKIAKELLK